MLSRRTFLQSAAVSTAFAMAQRPNVLWIMTDQHRYDALGANGNRQIRTPHLDRLAARSANFSHAFVQAPVCVPSRISYFTGRYPHSHRNRVNYTPVNQSETLIQRRLKDAGYQTGSAGKLHFYPPTNEHARSTGFDRVWLDDGVGQTDRFSDYVRWRKENDPQAAMPYQATVKGPAGGTNPYRGIIDYRYSPTAWVGMKTRDILREFAGREQPFFLFSSFFKPHSPHTVPEPYDSMYNDVEIPLPSKFSLEEIHNLPLPVQKQILRGTPQYDMDRARLQWQYRSYYASVSMVDREIGEILDVLDKTGKTAGTIVILSTDHGDQMLEHGLEGKNVFFESSVRVPFLISWPGVIRPGRYDELIEMVDVLPTVLDLCSLPIAKEIQGRSFAPLVAEGKGSYSARDAVFAENIIPEVITSGKLNMRYEPGKGVGGIRHPDAKMVRTRRWKFNYYPGHACELYDLQNDPGETRNLYRDPQSQQIVAEMKQRILDWMITADEADQIAPHWLVSN